MRHILFIFGIAIVLLSALVFSPARYFQAIAQIPSQPPSSGPGFSLPANAQLLGTNNSMQAQSLTYLSLPEISAPSGVASSDILYPDNTAHAWKVINNNGTAAQMVISGADINTSSQVTVTHLAAPLPLAQGGTNCGNPTVFASLPGSPTNGYLCSVTDASACTCGTAVTTGGGSVKCDLTYNGTNWMPCGGASASAAGGFSTAGTGLTSAGATVSLINPVTVATGGTQCQGPNTFSNLPGSPTNGMICNLTDAPNCYVGIAVAAGGGSTKCQVTYNGTSWFPSGATKNGVTGGPIRPTAPIANVPTAGQIYPTALADTINFPANFAAAAPDPASVVGACQVNPSETDAYQISCFNGAESYIGGVIIPPAGAGSATFVTGNVPFVRSFTTATPGQNGGSINVPTGVQNNDLLIWTATAIAPCVTPSGWTLENSYNGFDGDYSCTLMRIASSEPSTYSYSCSSCYPALTMMDVAGAPTTLVAAVDAITNAVGDNTTPSIPATGTLSTSQDLYIGFLLSYNQTTTFTPPTGSVQIANIPFNLGTSAGSWVSYQNLTANSKAADATGSYSATTFWQATTIAIAPAAHGGTATCAAGSDIHIIAPSLTVSGVCPITLAGHAS